MPYRAKRLFADHDVSHVKDRGWEQLKNGQLLAAAAEAAFDVMITVDKRIKYEQNLDHLPVSVIEIDIGDVRLPSIVAIAQKLQDALAHVRQFRFIRIDQDGQIIPSAERQ